MATASDVKTLVVNVMTNLVVMNAYLEDMVTIVKTLIIVQIIQINVPSAVTQSVLHALLEDMGLFVHFHARLIVWTRFVIKAMAVVLKAVNLDSTVLNVSIIVHIFV